MRDEMETENAMEIFMEDRLKENALIGFYEPVKKLNLTSFQHMTKTVQLSVKERLVLLKFTCNLFGKMYIIMQHQNIDLKKVFTYPLGPLPWALAGPVGELRQTNKVALLHKLEKGIESIR